MPLLSARAQSRISRTVANLLLVALVLYLGVAMARITWLIAWDDRPVPSAPATDPARTLTYLVWGGRRGLSRVPG